ncbi:MAG: ChbG/HpnK family deacetylase [Deinococcales bacterium]
MRDRKIIINADDYGLSPAVSAGIIRGFEEGIVGSGSVLSNMPQVSDWIAKAPKALPLGLHLNITLGRPVLPVELVPSLVNDKGEFRSLPELLKVIHEVSLLELRAELQAQAVRMLEAGRDFDHINSHQHILVIYRPFVPLLLELIQQYQVPLRQPVPLKLNLPKRRRSGDYIWEYVQLGLQNPKAVVQNLPKMVFWKNNLAAEEFITTDYLVLDMFRNAKLENFEALLENLPKGTTEVVFHPADNLHEPDFNDRYTLEERSNELEMLCHPDARSLLHKHEIELTNFSKLAA